MALAASALISVQALKDARVWEGNDSDPGIERSIETASEIIRGYVGWPVVGISAVTEYHTPKFYTHELRLLDKPIVTITSVHEDTAREFGASTLLAANTDYIVSVSRGMLIRVRDGLPIAWACGWRCIKVVGSFGYLNQAGTPVPTGAPAVPQDLADACVWITSRIFHERDRGQFDVSSITDATGSVTRFSGSRLPTYIRERLNPYRRWDQSPTGERDT